MRITKRMLPQLAVMTILTVGLGAPRARAAEPGGEPTAGGGLSLDSSPTASSERTADAEPLSDTTPSDTDWQFVGGLATWAVGMGLVAVFNYSFFRLNDAVREDAMKSYRAGVPEGESSCDRAHAGLPSTAAGAASASEVAALCDEADTMELLRNITLPIGLGVSILGLALLGTSDTVAADPPASESAGRWRFRVAGGPSAVGATATVDFF